MVVDDKLIRQILREDLGAFTRRAFSELRPGETFVHGFHIDAISEALMRAERGEVKRLIITCPPRSLKSLLTSVTFPALLLGHRPHRKVMCISYGDRLAQQHALDTRLLMNSAFYRDLFPGVLRPGVHKLQDLRTLQHGYRQAYSITGGVRGGGADFIILDDPLKGIESASKAERQRVNGLYDQVIPGRLNNKNNGCIIIVMQRIHQDDLVGHVLDRGDWEHLCIPAIATARTTYVLSFGREHTREVGEVLQPEREDFERLMETKRTMGTYNFSAQYQQDPIPPEGNIFRREWFQYYDIVPGRFDRVLQSWDTGMQIGEQNDFSVCTTWGVLGDKLYLLDVIRERLEYPDLKRRVVEAADRHRPLVVVIEAAGAGIPLLQDLRGKIKHRLRRSNPRKGKELRAYAASATAEDKKIFLPRSASWLDDFISELIGFPGGRHDDQVDSFSQIVRWNLTYRKLFSGERPDPKRPAGRPFNSRPMGARRTRQD